MIRLLSRIRRNLRRSSERGQVLMFFALGIVPLTFVLGVVATDVTIWQSERRGAQKDVDLSALAGAVELILAQNKANAENAAINYANTNDEAGNADLPVAGSNPSIANTVVVDDACFPGNAVLPLNSVTVNVDHDSRTFFADFFGISVPDVGAHARACGGSLENPNGLRPFAIDKLTSPCFVQPTDVPPPDPADIGLPDFGAECTLDFGAQGGPATSNRGVLDLETNPAECSDTPGSGDLVAAIENGVNGTCYTQTGASCTSPYTNCVVGQTGNVANKTLEGIQALIASEGVCDALYGSDANTIDDVGEALALFPTNQPPSPLNQYTPRTCNAAGDISPRLITIVAVDEWLGSNDPMPLRYFTEMYVLGCNDPQGDLDKLCTGAGPNGHIQLRGIIFNVFLADSGQIGTPNDGGILGVALVE